MPEQHAAAHAFARMEQVPGRAAHYHDQPGDVTLQVGAPGERGIDVGERAERDDGERPLAQCLAQSRRLCLAHPEHRG